MAKSEQPPQSPLEALGDLLPWAQERALQLREAVKRQVEFAETATPRDLVDAELARRRTVAEAAEAAVEQARRVLKEAGHAS